MSQQAIKIGIQATVDVLDEDKLETNSDATSLDTTVNGIIGNTEVVRVIVADNAVLPHDQVQQVVQALRNILTNSRLTEIVQTP